MLIPHLCVLNIDNDGNHTSLWAELLQKDYYYATLYSYKPNLLVEEIVLPVIYKITLGINSIARKIGSRIGSPWVSTTEVVYHWLVTRL
ncbi:uncharacterized protein OCT59_012382 [Rhizophagus irregularis]|uniref:uncharacterized protein n=1 Tax=Rhizophagus irregularis TaxID=588596 RepID=UPI0019D82262|nr:hypothetical protein OCT59_012382 [Rhizophagus irregularis]GET64741.1 hypothetical protein RIR_jg7815.t1 [Rhizophagus irregularis DAOM 181602=DAOM 197198]